MFEGVAGYGISPALAKKVYYDDEAGRYDINASMAIIDIIENMPNSYFDALAFYMGRAGRLDLSGYSPELREALEEGYGDRAHLFMARYVNQAEAAELAGEPALSLYAQNMNRPEHHLGYALATIFTGVPDAPDPETRDYEDYLPHLKRFFESRRHEAPGIPQLIRHSKSLRAEFSENVLMSYGWNFVTTADFEMVHAQIDQALRDPGLFKKTMTGTLLGDRAQDLRSVDRMKTGFIINAMLYPQTKQDRHVLENWLYQMFINISSRLIVDEYIESDGEMSMVRLVERIENFVIEDAMEGSEYRSFMAAAILSTLFRYDPPRPKQLRELMKTSLKMNLKILSKRVAKRLMPQVSSVPKSGNLPTTVSREVAGIKTPNPDSLFAQNLRESRREKPNPYKLQIVEPQAPDELTPFITGEKPISELKPERPYAVHFRRQNPFFSGQQQIVFSQALLRDFGAHNDDRSTRARDWLEAIQQGLARPWERGIKRLKAEQFAWEVKIDGTVYRIMGNRQKNNQWYFQEFHSK